MPISQTITVRVRTEEKNLDRAVNVARTLRRVGTDDPPSENEANDALLDFLNITEVNGGKVLDHLDGFGSKRKITDG